MQCISIFFVFPHNFTISCPAFVIRGRIDGMSWRRCSQNVHYQAFVVTLNSKIHFPAKFGRPMPVQHLVFRVLLIWRFALIYPVREGSLEFTGYPHREFAAIRSSSNRAQPPTDRRRTTSRGNPRGRRRSKSRCGRGSGLDATLVGRSGVSRTQSRNFPAQRRQTDDPL